MARNGLSRALPLRHIPFEPVRLMAFELLNRDETASLSFRFCYWPDRGRCGRYLVARAMHAIGGLYEEWRYS